MVSQEGVCVDTAEKGTGFKLFIGIRDYISQQKERGRSVSPQSNNSNNNLVFECALLYFVTMTTALFIIYLFREFQCDFLKINFEINCNGQFRN